jgi:hypothetical protein
MPEATVTSNWQAAMVKAREFNKTPKGWRKRHTMVSNDEFYDNGPYCANPNGGCIAQSIYEETTFIVTNTHTKECRKGVLPDQISSVLAELNITDSYWM